MGSVDRGSAEDGALAAAQNSGIQRSIGVVVIAVVGRSEWELIILSTFGRLVDGTHVFYTNVASASDLVEVEIQRSSDDVDASTGHVPVVIDRSGPPLGTAAVSVGPGISSYSV